MSYKFSLKMLFAICLAIFVFGVNGYAQSVPMVGGSKAVSPNDPQVVKAANFAASTQGAEENAVFMRGTIYSAERQVVAGSIYRICMEFGESPDEYQQVLTEIFVDLKGKMTLRAWDVGECAGEESEEDPN